MNITQRLQEFIDSEGKSCSFITPEYVYSMWGGSVAIEEIEKAMAELRSYRNHRRKLKITIVYYDSIFIIERCDGSAWS